MAKWFSIESKNKKAFCVYEQYEHKEKKQKFNNLDYYRWGYVVVKVDQDISLDDFKKKINADNENTVFSTIDQYVADYESEDNAYQAYVDLENITEDQVIEMAEEDWDFEGTHNFKNIESWMEIDGPLEVKDLTEDYT